MEDLRIKESLRVFFDVVDQGMDKILRLATPRANEYPIPAIDLPETFSSGANFSGYFSFISSNTLRFSSNPIFT